MSLDVFFQALAVAKHYDQHITIGGGEPTLHPEFYRILCEVVAQSEKEMPPFIVTNGTNTKIALMLKNLSNMGAIDAHLSTDQYHDRDMVDAEVYEAFGYDDWDCDKGSGPIATGRWAEVNEFDEDTDSCVCEDMHISPNGDIKPCGCNDAPILGHVSDGEICFSQGCHKNPEENY